jgi:hypothetical protein
MLLIFLEKKMSEPNTFRINDVDYVRADSIKEAEGDIKIVVLDRGFVYVGHVSFDGDFVVVHDARNIRYWGTTKGLGELVNGPLQKTIIDAVGVVKAPLRALISIIDVDQSKWK